MITEEEKEELSETRKVLLNTLEEGMFTRPELVKLLQLKRSTVYDNLRELEKMGYVSRTTKKMNKKTGRPYTLWFRVDIYDENNI